MIKKIVINDSVPVTQWGNQTLKQIGVDESKPVQEVFYNDNVAGGGFVYFYLNFTDSTKAATFMQTYYAVENIKTNMDEYLSFYFGKNAGVKVNDPQAYLRYITNGNVLSLFWMLMERHRTDTCMRRQIQGLENCLVRNR